jgi:hypothetical protein
MTEKQEPLYIFHLFRQKGEPLILHPLMKPEKLVHSLENNEIVGRYGIEPRVEALTLLKNEFYRVVEMGVRTWVSDIRFIPKFLISAVIFLVSYFFLSFVVRDPLPVIDEVAISLGLSVLTYFLMSRRDIKSDIAAKKRLSLRAAIDRITFQESEFVKSLEKNLHENESASIDEIVQKILSPAKGSEISSKNRVEARHFIRACEAMFNLQNVKKEEKILKRYLEGPQKDQKIQDIRKWAESRKIDFPLYAVYKRCKSTVTTKTS